MIEAFFIFMGIITIPIILIFSVVQFVRWIAFVINDFRTVRKLHQAGKKLQQKRQEKRDF